MVRGCSLIFLLASPVSAFRVAEAACPEGQPDCSASISEEGQDSTWGRLMSIIFNQKKNVTQYIGRHTDDSLTERDMTNEYYDLATDFYEYGWGQSFHFATRWRGETLADSIARHEHYLASKLRLMAGQKVGDLGMGVGGPLRSIVKFSHADVTGVTINDYQIRRANRLTQQRESPELAKLMHYKQGDFTKLVPQVFEAGSLDAIYYIESSCHISNRTEVFLEGAKTLKTGGRLFAYEWVMTDHYDPKNAAHNEIKAAVEWGNGIEKLIPAREAVRSVEAAGFRVLEHGDLVDMAEDAYGENNVPWYHDMAQYFAFSSLSAFQLSDFGQSVLNKLLWFVAKIGLVPKDALDTEQMLVKGKRGLVDGGKLKIFTPMYYILAEKI